MVIVSPAWNAVLVMPQNSSPPLVVKAKNKINIVVSFFNLNYLSLKNLILNIRMLPARAGINKLMNHIPNVVPIIPTVFVL